MPMEPVVLFSVMSLTSASVCETTLCAAISLPALTAIDPSTVCTSVNWIASLSLIAVLPADIEERLLTLVVNAIRPAAADTFKSSAVTRPPATLPFAATSVTSPAIVPAFTVVTPR